MATAWWFVAGYKVWRNIHTCKQESKCLKKRYCIAVHEWTNELRNYPYIFFLVWIDVVSHQVIDVPLSVPSRSQTDLKFVCLCSFLMIAWFFLIFSTKSAIFGKHFEVCPPQNWPQGWQKTSPLVVDSAEFSPGRPRRICGSRGRVISLLDGSVAYLYHAWSGNMVILSPGVSGNVVLSGEEKTPMASAIQFCCRGLRVGWSLVWRDLPTIWFRTSTQGRGWV